jgi:hypothetical protein
MLGVYGPVTGNWCWITSEYLGLRYALGHGWRISVILSTIAIYTYVYMRLRSNSRNIERLREYSCNAVQTAFSQNEHITPRFIEDGMFRTSAEHAGAESKTSELGLQVPNKLPASVLTDSISMPQSRSKKSKVLTNTRNKPRRRSDGYGRAMCLHGYPLMYIVFWVPGIANRVAEALGTVPLWLRALQASTQFVGLANVLTYAITERVNERFVEWYKTISGDV